MQKPANPHVVITDQGRIRIIRLDRADKANALTKEMLVALMAAFDAPDAALIILTGVGKVFSAGADLEAARAGLARDDIWDRLSARIAAAPCLTIAALNGTVAGGALGLILACDLRLSVAEAGFFYPVMRLGYLPQPQDPIRMSALIGPARTRMILMAGARIDADQALAWGLIDRIVPHDGLIAAATALAQDALTAPHLAAIKTMMP